MARPRKPARSGVRERLSTALALRMPVLEQRQLDVIGLGLVALGVFLACVLYLGWAGGRAGDGLHEGLRWLLGVLAFAVPAALVAGGALVALRPVLPARRPLRTGVLCLAAAVALALAAGTLGLGPHDPVRVRAFDPDVFRVRSGAMGETLYWASSSLLGATGTHILAAFLFAVGALLLTGATVASAVNATGSHVVSTSRRLRRSSPALAALRRAERRRLEDDDEDAEHGAEAHDEALEPPDLETQELVVRATHVEGPSLDGRERYPDLYGDDPPAGGDGPGEEATVALVREPGGPDQGETEALEPRPDAEQEPDGPGGEREAGRAARPEQMALTPQGRYRASVTEAEDFVWKVPSPRLLTRSRGEAARPDTSGQARTAAQLLEGLGHFGVDAKVVGTVAGPHITRYELRLAPGVKMAKVANLKDDLAYALAATDIRILAPIPGKQAVGVEVPNARRRIVHLGDVWQDSPEDYSPLGVWLGKDVAGRAIGADLAKMPHILVAGTTGAGKSGCINAMLSSILLRATPRDMRLVLVDPKQVELNHYESIPHLITPVITSPRKAANALANLVKEMEERYGMMSLARTRSLPELNRARERRGEAPLPYVLCVIDELADLMMVAPAEVEDSIIRLAQKARAVGIHLVLATQSPRVDVITGMIKANVPSRIAFAVSSQTDSRVILDQNGAESLLGQGDMLFSPIGTSRLQRIQGAYIDEAQIEKLTDFWRGQGEPDFREELLAEVESADDGLAGGDEDGMDPDEDPLLEDAVRLVAEMQTASTSMLQRRLRLGYTRAGRLIDMLERRGVISGYEGSKPRQVLITETDLPRVLANLAERGSGAPARAPEAEPVGVDDGE
jgi:S-DNA-T family DNA segregation ATPase FtsK/SpoIIIE